MKTIYFAGGCFWCITGGNDCPIFGDRQTRFGKKTGSYDDLGHAAYEEAKDFNQVIYDFLIER